jgi:hypothetical protein
MSRYGAVSKSTGPKIEDPFQKTVTALETEKNEIF